MASISVTVEVNFGGIKPSPPHLVDVSADVLGATIEYGRLRAVDTFASGYCHVDLNNSSGTYTPDGPGATYGDDIYLGREVRISASVSGSTPSIPLWRGYVTDVDCIADTHTSVVTLKCSDALWKLGSTQLAAYTASSEVASARFTDVLDDAAVDFPAEPGSPSVTDPSNRSISTSVIQLQAQSSTDAFTMDYFDKIVQSEDGALYVGQGVPGNATPTAGNRGGVLTFRSRQEDPSDTGLTVTEGSPTSATSLPFREVSTQYGSELLFNKATYTREGGTAQTVTDTTAKAALGAFQQVVRTGLLNNDDADCRTAAEYFVYRHANPSLRVERVTLVPTAMTDDQALAALKLTIWDGITVAFTPPGASGQLSAPCRVEGVQHRIQPGLIQSTLTTSAADEGNYLILDDPIAGLLNTGRLAPAA